jgi:transposase
MAVWSPRGQTPSLRVSSQRDKVCFYGTLDLHTGQEIVSREEKMNSEATARHLELILATYPEKPILLLWDRATWHGGQAVRSILEANPRLEVMRFPTASPDLNPQEQVWKATRIATSHNHEARDMTLLANRFEQHLSVTTFSHSLLETYNYNTVCAIFK